MPFKLFKKFKLLKFTHYLKNRHFFILLRIEKSYFLIFLNSEFNSKHQIKSEIRHIHQYFIPNHIANKVNILVNIDDPLDPANVVIVTF